MHWPTQLLVSPLEFMQRLAALVPRPRLHLVRLHGELACRVRGAIEMENGCLKSLSFDEAAHSRLQAGIHFRSGMAGEQVQGRCVAQRPLGLKARW